ncbi:PQQ repeat-containing protein [Halogeometricum pallidum JCM 14848]|uniref:PQQ repeat-containing protein n=1 Tax=Halogeometricum pallidum JCM 14848 TaxID=1227487 RepID=M0D5X6_HALPD|nr:PQQ-binding-like beta-propeller repeat protein [Halogeometricum pallidum]ELZ30875.1 PQQ repeat-containing protein [Halogeometricum pallidum JCM 14848]
MRPPPRRSDRRSTRRSFLQLSGLALAAAAGCASRGDDASSPTDAPPRPSTATPTESPPATETYGPTDGPDERLTRTPPGDPPLNPDGSWPQYRFDAGNTGYASEAEGLRDGVGYWSLNGGHVPSVADGALYNLHVGDETTDFTRRDPATATVRSRTELVDYGTNSPPAVADDRAFVTTFAEVFCLATDRDEVLWRGPRTRGIQGAPTVVDDALLVNCGGFTETEPQLSAFDFDGTERWTYESGFDSNSTPAVGDGAVFVSTEADIRAVELATGEERFVTDTVHDRWANVVVSDGTAYVAGHVGNEDDRVYALNASDGSVEWRTGPFRNRPGPPVVAGGTVYVGGAGDAMLALDAEDGAQVREFGRRAEPICRAGDVLYARQDGWLYAYDATTGEGLWSYRTPEVQVSDQIMQGVYGVTPVGSAVYVDAADGLHGIGPAG